MSSEKWRPFCLGLHVLSNMSKASYSDNEHHRITISGTVRINISLSRDRCIWNGTGLTLHSAHWEHAIISSTTDNPRLTMGNMSTKIMRASWSSEWRHRNPSIGNPIVEIRRSYDRLISIVGFPILVRYCLHIESGPWMYYAAAPRQTVPRSTLCANKD